MITDVRGSCGLHRGARLATLPVPPAGGAITVTFDSEGRSGHQEKRQRGGQHHPPTTILYLGREVLAPAGALPVE